ncbi:Receptor-type tyrosine-protein phosphatase T [Dirofilaria immitis]|nr:Receptor-type tyrosine-protein phosphatase T [Dirofilaria immitis]
MKRAGSRRRRRPVTMEEEVTVEGDAIGSSVSAVKSLKKATTRRRKVVDQSIPQKITGVAGLRREFEELKMFVPPNNAHEACAANLTRNRYRDVPCLDVTRVILTLNVPPETDYIHANWMKMEGCPHQYIATQGPLESTASDFWRMVHQEQITTIIMLCKTFEDGKPKCFQYWPAENGENKTYGCMFVMNKRSEHEDKFETYLLEVLPEGCSNSTIVKLIHMTDWPDRGVPQSGMTVLRLIRMMPNNATSIIHCSAGIGRTGTVIAIDTLLSRLWKNQPLNVPQVVKEMRSQRASSVQNEAQYVFIYSTVLDYIKAKLPLKYREFVVSFHAEFVYIKVAAIMPVAYLDIRNKTNTDFRISIFETIVNSSAIHYPPYLYNSILPNNLSDYFHVSQRFNRTTKNFSSRLLAKAQLAPPQGGPRGLPGRRGRDGSRGIQGEKGDIGAEGDEGEKGIPGIAGPPGEEGDLGVQGAVGDQGLVGIRGMHTEGINEEEKEKWSLCYDDQKLWRSQNRLENSELDDECKHLISLTKYMIQLPTSHTMTP